MSETTPTIDPKNLQTSLETLLHYLKLSFMQDHYEPLAKQAANDQWSHVDYLTALAQGEAARQHDRSIQRRIRMARFPVLKTLDQFRWSWPKKINRATVQNLFRLKFLEEKANVIFLGGVASEKPISPPPSVTPPACRGNPSFSLPPLMPSILSPLHKRPIVSNPNSKNISPPHCSFATNSGFCPSTSMGPISSSRSSAFATSRALLSSPPIDPSNNGPRFSTTTPPSLLPFSIGSYTMLRLSSSRAKAIE